MYRYFIKTPWIVRQLFPSFIWRIPTKEKEIYLSFDDGPHPQITPWVMRILKEHNALASFFCIGKNVALYPDVYQEILLAGHSVGNHTFNHLNGWQTNTETYVADVEEASKYISTNLFRPPYGKIKKAQARKLWNGIVPAPKIIMWDVLSGDFDRSITKEQCLKNVLDNYAPGSIIVFHDSEKARLNLAYALPIVLKILGEEGYVFKKIDLGHP